MEVPEALGSRVADEAFEVCIALPGEEAGDAEAPDAVRREDVLAASGLGQQHFTGPGCNLARLCAASCPSSQCLAPSLDDTACNTSTRSALCHLCRAPSCFLSIQSVVLSTFS